jgi:hypothetical protein
VLWPPRQHARRDRASPRQLPIAEAEAPFFEGIDLPVLEKTIATYQKLGNWTPHDDITRPALAATLDVFPHAGLTSRRTSTRTSLRCPPGRAK